MTYLLYVDGASHPSDFDDSLEEALKEGDARAAEGCDCLSLWRLADESQEPLFDGDAVSWRAWRRAQDGSQIETVIVETGPRRRPSALAELARALSGMQSL